MTGRTTNVLAEAGNIRDRSQASIRQAVTSELPKNGELPKWLQHNPDYGLWQRSNLWMLYNALALGGSETALIALRDGAGGDGRRHAAHGGVRPASRSTHGDHQ